MADLDVNANIQNQITACRKEIKQNESRIDFLSGVASRLPTTVDFKKRRDTVKVTLDMICAMITSPADHGNTHNEYDSIIVMKKHGSSKYTWYIVIKVHGISAMSKIPENFPVIPFEFSAESDGFLRYLSAEGHIQYYHEHEPIVLTHLNNLRKHGLQYTANSMDYQ
jgi:hypothetical protein